MQLACQIQRQEIGRVEIFLVADYLTEKAQLFYQRKGFAKVNWGSAEKIDQLRRDTNYFENKISVPMRLKRGPVICTYPITRTH